MSLNRLNIKEANDHLKQLHQRVYELENQVHMQAMHAEELQKSNLELQHRLQETLQQKEEASQAKDSQVDHQVAELTQRLQESESRVQQLLEAAEVRDAAMMKLETKARLFYEVVEHKPALARILEVLEELSIGAELVEEGSGGMGDKGLPGGGGVGSDGLIQRPQVASKQGTNSNLNGGDSSPSPQATDRWDDDMHRSRLREFNQH